MPNPQCEECGRTLEVGDTLFTIDIGMFDGESCTMLPLTKETGGKLACAGCAPKTFNLWAAQIVLAESALSKHVALLKLDADTE